ncbi:MAG: class I SAM-dependent methyltransferase [Candidatus Omnitrophota bacterium]|nr:class I SAM-dependent methyltransferase [Candidatus Omnitrophota bacterium]
MIKGGFGATFWLAARLFLHPKSPAAVYKNPVPFILHVYARLANLWISARGGDQVCLICGRRGAFGYVAAISDQTLIRNSLCFGCGSNSRTRTLLFYLKSRLPNGQLKILDIGPLKSTRLFFRDLDCTYETLDRYGEATYHDDVTDMSSIPDETYDIIFCVQVLQHISDDLGAMSEIRRILKPDGVAYVVVHQFPSSDKTRRSPQASYLGYGFEWLYGEDFRVRLESAGFFADMISTDKFISEQDLKRHGLMAQVLYASRPKATAKS